MNMPFDLLLGPAKPSRFGRRIRRRSPTNITGSSGNDPTKYDLEYHERQANGGSQYFSAEMLREESTNIKQQQGPDLHVWGSGNLIQTLIKHDLVDAFWLMIYPITLGGGKRLFADGTIPMAFKVTESKVTPRGVIVVNYERAGAITTGSL